MRKSLSVTLFALTLLAIAFTLSSTLRLKQVAEASSFAGWTIASKANYTGKEPMPIEIVKLVSNGKEALYGESLFSRSIDLSDAQVAIRSRTDKTIKAIQLDIVVRDPQTDAPVGYSPAAVFKGHVSFNAEVSTSFIKDKIASLAKSMTEARVPLKNSTLEIGHVFFTDNTQWTRGYLLQQDTVNPRLWTVIGREDQIGYLRRKAEFGVSVFNAGLTRKASCGAYAGQLLDPCGPGGMCSVAADITFGNGTSQLNDVLGTCGILGESCAFVTQTSREGSCLAN